MNWTTLFILLTVTFGAALFFLWRRLMAQPTSLPVTATWIEELSPERYRPMFHLLDTEDLESFAAQPGFTPGAARRLRAQRCKLFCGYLRCLRADFARVVAAMKLILLCSAQERPELSSALLEQQVKFALTLAKVYVSLFLFRWDLCRVDVVPLVRIFDSMRLQLQSLVPANAELVA
ncbi:MAG TPA: hypothetical protein VKV17_22000 [Bryobacteraceae bacterium]|nr:hypothetical protein [Bryobacteraceae bacterium]